MNIHVVHIHVVHKHTYTALIMSVCFCLFQWRNTECAEDSENEFIHHIVQAVLSELHKNAC